MEVARGFTTVNDPISYDGYRFHQSGYFGEGAALRIRDVESGNTTYSEVLGLSELVPAPKLVVWDAAGATITWRSTPDTGDNRITIPQGKLPNGSGVVGAPYNIAALDGTWRRGGDILISTAADPVKTGDTAGTTLTIN